MSESSFPCKVEELPVIGSFLLNSLKTDMSDFADFSPIFNSAYLERAEQLINSSKDIVASSTVTKELKATTDRMYSCSDGLRVPMNRLEGYLNLAADTLDISVKDFGINKVRNNIQRKNIEGLLAEMSKVLVAIMRNQTALSAVGLACPEFCTEMEVRIGDINALNSKQNELVSKRGRLTDSNMVTLNNLWTHLQPILKVGQALYKGVDPVKLKEYTMSQVMKQVQRTVAKPAKEEE